MPIYEYRCTACGHEHEAIQKVADDPLTDCPQCGRPELKRLISPVAFRLKGGGWYETDFKTGDRKKNVVKEDKEPAKTESKTESKTDAKAADKPAKTTTE